MYSSEYNLPVFIGTGSVASSGSTADLKPGQVGIFDSRTYSAVTASVASNRSVIVAGGSWHTKSKLNKFVGNLQTSDKTIDFLGKDILEFHRSRPRTAQSEEWVLGWDGITANTSTLAFQCGKDYHFKVRVWGEDVYGTFLRPVDRFIRVRTKCCADGDCATSDCADAVPGKSYAKQLAKVINEDPELKYFVRAEIISSDYSAPSTTHNLYNMSVIDDGSVMSLSAVQVGNPTLVITRVSRVGLTSTYQTCVKIGDAVPTAFTAAGSLALADCAGACPATYTLTPARDVFIINRPLAGTEDLTTSGTQATFAAAVGTAYYPIKNFDGVTAVDPVTNQITIASHGYIANQSVVYANGGFASVVGLTTATTYYIKTVVDANNVTLSATPGGTVIDITADGGAGNHTLTAGRKVTFLSQNGASASIELQVDAIVADPAALLADSVTKVATTRALCVPPAGSSNSWVIGDNRYKITRTLNLTLEKVCGSANRLADLTAFYAANTSLATAISVATSGTCNDVYTVTQYNDTCSVDNCLSPSEINFADMPSFEGFDWVEIPVADTDTTIKTGIRVRTAYEDTRFGGCSFNPADYYSVRPLKLEIVQFDDSGLPCATPVPSRKTKNVSMATQSGEWVIRQFINANKYRAFGEFYMDPRLREVLDANIHEVVDRNKRYVLYFLKVRQNRLYQNHNADFSPEIFEFMFAFPEDVDTAAFETAFEKVTSQFGVFLQDR